MTDTALMAQTLSVSEVAEDAGVAASAVRFYEQHGLVSATSTATTGRALEAATRAGTARTRSR